MKVLKKDNTKLKKVKTLGSVLSFLIIEDINFYRNINYFN